MPIYEFYCRRCHVLFNFFSATVDTESRPSCPRCGSQPLDRRPARFATLRHRGEGEPDPLDRLADDKVEGAMSSLLEEMGDLEEGDDPRKLARVFRRLGEASGMELGPRMEELIGRLEAGEDLEGLEAEMEDAFGDGEEGMEELFRLKQRAAARRQRRPEVDETLYFL